MVPTKFNTKNQPITIMLTNLQRDIIASLEQMNLNMLAATLSGQKTYMLLRKSVFLEKIKTAFAQYKALGDDQLLAVAGTCGSRACSGHGCPGFAFVGNHSGAYLSFVFNQDAQQENVLQQCRALIPDDDRVMLQQPISIEVMWDEHADFQPSESFREEERIYRAACQELESLKDRVIGQAEYLPWLRKYRLTHLAGHKDLSNIFYDAASAFFSLYDTFRQLATGLNMVDKAEEALARYHQLDKDNERELLAWLVRYEALERDFPTLLLCDFEEEEPAEREYFEVHGFKIRAAEFGRAPEFATIFSGHHSRMMDKYTTFRELDFKSVAFDDDEVFFNMNRLSYHLKKRGIELPDGGAY